MHTTAVGVSVIESAFTTMDIRLLAVGVVALISFPRLYCRVRSYNPIVPMLLQLQFSVIAEAGVASAAAIVDYYPQKKEHQHANR